MSKTDNEITAAIQTVTELIEDGQKLAVIGFIPARHPLLRPHEIPEFLRSIQLDIIAVRKP